MLVDSFCLPSQRYPLSIEPVEELEVMNDDPQPPELAEMSHENPRPPEASELVAEGDLPPRNCCERVVACWGGLYQRLQSPVATPSQEIRRIAVSPKPSPTSRGITWSPEGISARYKLDGVRVQVTS